jgi:hypothetical protein
MTVLMGQDENTTSGFARMGEDRMEHRASWEGSYEMREDL